MVTTRSNAYLRNRTRSHTGKSTPFLELEPIKRVKKQKPTVPQVLSIEHPDDLDSIDSEISIMPSAPSNKNSTFMFSPLSQICFDDAHDEWVSNKRKLPNGMYEYLCMKPLKNGKTCQKACYDKIGLYSGCRQHYAWEEKKNKYL
mgnify:CR=1 FL=1